MGSYIAFEGPEAGGKSTQAARLAAELHAVLTRETGGTAIGLRIREILHDTSIHDMSPRTEALLAAADRAQHLVEVVEPALAAGRHVVSDRSVYSTLAYQAYGRGLDIDVVRTTNDWAIAGRWPDLVILVDVPDTIVEARLRDRTLDRFEREDTEFHRRVRAGFHAMAAADPDHWVVIDGSAPIDEVARAVRTAVRERLGI